MNKLRLWFFKHFLCADTVHQEFEIWFERMLGRGLQSSGVFYAIAVQGQEGIPKIQGDWKVYADIKKAERKMKGLQESNPKHILELRVVRNFYSEVK